MASSAAPRNSNQAPGGMATAARLPGRRAGRLARPPGVAFVPQAPASFSAQS
ncbi:hypothetical protein ROS9278_00327 [Roseomonas sp. CECT 9278]|nr:hypothetical protein ROS9278_00327 [Roseomonas sp. CECT 9278]